MSFSLKKSQKAFTLLELLIVITIIGILSGIILVSLSNARDKARDAAVMREAKQFTLLLQQQFSETGSFAALQSGWDSTAAECANSFSGNHVASAREICTSIVRKIVLPTNKFYTGTSLGNVSNFSVMARLSSGFYYCVGSSGQTSIVGTGNGPVWTQSGCYANP